jgi:hypothetical protein
MTRIYLALFSIYCRAVHLHWDHKYKEWLQDDGHGGWSEVIPEGVVLLGFWFFMIGVPACVGAVVLMAIRAVN